MGERRGEPAEAAASGFLIPKQGPGMRKEVTMRRYGLSVLSLAFLCIPTIAPGAPVPSSDGPDVELTIYFDRDSYLSLEPIHVEWSLKNRGTESVRMVFPQDRMSFTFTDPDGKETHAVNQSTSDGPPTYSRLNAAASQKGWFPLQDDHEPIPRIGKFQVHASFWLSYLGNREDRRKVLVKSKPISVKFIAPTGAEAKALEVIRRIRHKTIPDDPDVNPDRLKERRHHVENTWMGDADLRRVLLDTPDAGRYRDAAAFSDAEACYWAARDRDRGEDTRREALKRAARNFRMCADSDASSTYVKGLAAYHLLLCKKLEQPAPTDAELKKIAERVIADYPHTFMAQEAEKLTGAERQDK
jgi:hypothetical protein